MFSCCCKLKKIISQEEKLLSDMLLMDEEKGLILQKQDEHNEFDLKLDLLDRKYREEQIKSIQKKQKQKEESEPAQNKEKQNQNVAVRRVLRMADYVKNNKDTQNGISL